MDKKNERQHELNMFQLQTDLEKMRGQFKMEEKYVDHSIAQLDTIKAAFEEQAETAKSAGWFVASISALVRPGITWSPLCTQPLRLPPSTLRLNHKRVGRTC
jgi:hypothetical protein